MTSKRTTLLAVGGVAVGLLAARAAYQAIKRYGSQDVLTAQHQVQSWQPVGTVAALCIHPIKSCHRIEVEEGECLTLGLSSGTDLRDRCFMVVNEKNNFLHARIHPHMVLIQPEITDGAMTLSAPDMEPITFLVPSQPLSNETAITVKVWGEEVPAVDCGDEVATWLSKYIFKQDSGARLVYYPSQITSRSVKTKSVHPMMKEKDGAVFQDLAPFMLMTEESVADLNTHLSEANQVSVHNFRPNIIVKGSPAFAEDGWKFIKIGQEATFRVMKPCDRCVLTTVNHETGVKHPEMEPLRTLRTYRLPSDAAMRKVNGDAPLFGMNYAVEKYGRIRVGDQVYVGLL